MSRERERVQARPALKIFSKSLRYFTGISELNRRCRAAVEVWRDETYAGRVGRRRPDRASEIESASSFAFPADTAILDIFNKYTTIRELIAYPIGRREVFFLPGRLPLGHLLIDIGVA